MRFRLLLPSSRPLPPLLSIVLERILYFCEKSLKSFKDICSFYSGVFEPPGNLVPPHLFEVWQYHFFRWKLTRQVKSWHIGKVWETRLKWYPLFLNIIPGSFCKFLFWLLACLLLFLGDLAHRRLSSKTKEGPFAFSVRALLCFAKRFSGLYTKSHIKVL